MNSSRVKRLYQEFHAGDLPLDASLYQRTELCVLRNNSTFYSSCKPWINNYKNNSSSSTLNVEEACKRLIYVPYIMLLCIFPERNRLNYLIKFMKFQCKFMKSSKFVKFIQTFVKLKCLSKTILCAVQPQQRKENKVIKQYQISCSIIFDLVFCLIVLTSHTA